MLSLHYKDNPVHLLQKYSEECSRQEFQENAKLLHEEMVQWYVDHEEELKSVNKEDTNTMGRALTRAGTVLNNGRPEELIGQYQQFLGGHESIINQNVGQKKVKKKMDRYYATWKQSFLNATFFVSQEFLHELKKLDDEELEHATKGIQEIQQYHELIHKITTGQHNHHDVPKSLKYYPKSNLWGVRCGNKHELIIFSYHPETRTYKLCDYIDYHTHDEASAHRGRYYELYEIGSRTEKTYNFRDGITLSKKKIHNQSPVASHPIVLFPFEMSNLTVDELELMGV